MHFGIFMEFESRQGRSQTESFREGFELVEAADTWGLDGVWLGEMHFNPARSVLGAPITDCRRSGHSGSDQRRTL
jgi:alkanesulfonate monooxygenase SsuD/methylene tetrahydromethanopterin reductase-like flavin-dependent oxidoreductase (luciferase family)